MESANSYKRGWEGGWIQIRTLFGPFLNWIEVLIKFGRWGILILTSYRRCCHRIHCSTIIGSSPLMYSSCQRYWRGSGGSSIQKVAIGGWKGSDSTLPSSLFCRGPSRPGQYQRTAGSYSPSIPRSEHSWIWKDAWVGKCSHRLCPLDYQGRRR